jgi:chemotaxis protein methyltransferase CheR
MSSELNKFSFSKTEALKSGQGVNEFAPGGNISGIYLENETFTRLRDYIYERSGIYYNESKKYILEGRIYKRIIANKVKNYEEYYELLLSGNGKGELKNLLDVITINETYFFRAPQQLDAFEKIIVPEIINRKSEKISTEKVKKTLRIWSAASSTGEEPYTLAMIIHNKIQPLYPDVHFQILASDINNSALDFARKGIYKEYSIKTVPEEYLKRYFKNSDSGLILTDEIKQKVKFANINLYDSTSISAVNNCDIIFCCNVLLYFNINSRQEVVANLYKALSNGGYLIIGYSESLHGISKAFKLIHLPKAIAYKKE